MTPLGVWMLRMLHPRAWATAGFRVVPSSMDAGRGRGRAWQLDTRPDSCKIAVTTWASGLNESQRKRSDAREQVGGCSRGPAVLPRAEWIALSSTSRRRRAGRRGVERFGAPVPSSVASRLASARRLTLSA